MNATTTTTSIPTVSAPLAASPDGSLYRVPVAAWTAINTRVGVAIWCAAFSPGATAAIASSLPGFPALLSASQQWRATTFPGLLSDASGAAAAAGRAQGSLGPLGLALGSVPPAAPLAEGLAGQATSAIAGVHADAVGLAASAAKLQSDVLAFRSANLEIDRQMETYRGLAGAVWAPVSDEIAAVENALGSVAGRWGAIAADLADIASGTVPPTAPILAALTATAALAAWADLAREADAFAAIGPSQQMILAGTNPGSRGGS